MHPVIRVPVLASLSKCGVFIFRPSTPNQSPRCWSAVIKMMFGRFAVWLIDRGSGGLRFKNSSYSAAGN